MKTIEEKIFFNNKDAGWGENLNERYEELSLYQKQLINKWEPYLQSIEDENLKRIISISSEYASKLVKLSMEVFGGEEFFHEELQGVLYPIILRILKAENEKKALTQNLKWIHVFTTNLVIDLDKKCSEIKQTPIGYRNLDGVDHTIEFMVNYCKQFDFTKYRTEFI